MRSDFPSTPGREYRQAFEEPSVDSFGRGKRLGQNQGVRWIRREVLRVVGKDGIRHDVGTKWLNRLLIRIVLNETGYAANVPGDNTDDTVGRIMLGVDRIGVAESRAID